VSGQASSSPPSAPLDSLGELVAACIGGSEGAKRSPHLNPTTAVNCTDCTDCEKRPVRPPARRTCNHNALVGDLEGTRLWWRWLARWRWLEGLEGQHVEYIPCGGRSRPGHSLDGSLVAFMAFRSSSAPELVLTLLVLVVLRLLTEPQFATPARGHTWP